MPPSTASGTRRFLDALVNKLGDLVGPASLGALYFGYWSLRTFWGSMGDDRINGVQAPALRQLIATDFRGVAAEAMGLMLSVSLLVGLGLGAAAGLVVKAVDLVMKRPRRRPIALGWRALGIVVCFHGFVWLDDVASRPQLYEDWLYARGGLLRWLQVLVTHWLGRAGVATLGILVVVAALALALRPLTVLRDSLSRIWQRLLSHRRVALASLSVLVVAGALAAFGGGVPAHARGARPNVLVIGADSLRTDRISPTTTPRLAALADRATRFDRAHVPLPRTFPSWVSLLTGRYPHHHGIRHMFPRWEARNKDLLPITRSLQKSGYRTSVVTDFAGDIFRRADLGFDRVLAPTFNLREVVRERIVEGHKPLLPFLRGRWARWALPVLREIHTSADAASLTGEALDEVDREPGRPFFLTVFYSTPHFPYAASSPHYKSFTDPQYRGRYLYSKAQVLGREAPPDEADVRQIRALFDGAVLATDAAIGELLAGLEARGLLDNTIVVVTADHGECLYEPGRGQGHGDHLFGNEAAAVPLLIVDPSHRVPGRVSQVTSTVDLAPTLCELAKVSCPEGMDGRSLVPWLRGQTLPARPVFAETGLWFTEQIAEVPPRLRFPYPDLPYFTEVVREHQDEIAIRPEYEPITNAAKHRMIRGDRYKLLYMPGRDGVVWELYDTTADPEERINVLARETVVAEELKQALWRWMLEDEQFERRGEYLLPKPGQLGEARALARGLRLEERVR